MDYRSATQIVSGRYNERGLLEAASAFEAGEAGSYGLRTSRLKTYRRSARLMKKVLAGNQSDIKPNTALYGDNECLDGVGN